MRLIPVGEKLVVVVEFVFVGTVADSTLVTHSVVRLQDIARESPPTLGESTVTHR